MKNAGIGIAVAIVLIGIFWFFGTKNQLITLKEDVNLKQAQVQTTLQRRSDLIPNLVNTVKGYATHEEAVFTEIAEARAKLAGSIESGDIEDMEDSYNALDSAIGRLLVISEDYPDLQASKQYTALMDELAGTENRISVTRQYYNEAVYNYNVAIDKMPASIVASLSGYRPAKSFEADEKSQEVPIVNFD